MSCLSQNFRLLNVSNLSVRNFRIILFIYTRSMSDVLHRLCYPHSAPFPRPHWASATSGEENTWEDEAAGSTRLEITPLLHTQTDFEELPAVCGRRWKNPVAAHTPWCGAEWSVYGPECRQCPGWHDDERGLSSTRDWSRRLPESWVRTLLRAPARTPPRTVVQTKAVC